MADNLKQLDDLLTTKHNDQMFNVTEAMLAIAQALNRIAAALEDSNKEPKPRS